MPSSELPFLPAAETANAIRTKQVSPVAVVPAYLDRIDRLSSTLSATRVRTGRTLVHQASASGGVASSACPPRRLARTEGQA
jgi:Asp-tRNA(Asn)/Glu-tRNA(Gln) amidotransferase A subunit family amidase